MCVYQSALVEYRHRERDDTQRITGRENVPNMADKNRRIRYVGERERRAHKRPWHCCASTTKEKRSYSVLLVFIARLFGTTATLLKFLSCAVCVDFNIYPLRIINENEEPSTKLSTEHELSARNAHTHCTSLTPAIITLLILQSQFVVMLVIHTVQVCGCARVRPTVQI